MQKQLTKMGGNVNTRLVSLYVSAPPFFQPRKPSSLPRVRVPPPLKGKSQGSPVTPGMPASPRHSPTFPKQGCRPGHLPAFLWASCNSLSFPHPTSPTPQLFRKQGLHLVHTRAHKGPTEPGPGGRRCSVTSEKLDTIKATQWDSSHMVPRVMGFHKPEFRKKNVSIGLNLAGQDRQAERIVCGMKNT